MKCFLFWTFYGKFCKCQIKNNDKYETSVSSHLGFYRYTCKPFGLRNARANFKRELNNISLESCERVSRFGWWRFSTLKIIAKTSMTSLKCIADPILPRGSRVLGFFIRCRHTNNICGEKSQNILHPYILSFSVLVLNIIWLQKLGRT